MTRSPLAYPMHRHDVDAGADLQTDVMRFMAILALCLVAIFALVQSIPLTPVAGAEPPAAVAGIEPAPAPNSEAVPEPRPVPVSGTRAEAIPAPLPEARPEPFADAAPVAATEPAAAATPEPPAAPVQQGFTLRFESDLALTRLVAAGRVGLYAIADGRARRMTVAESRLSFWDASLPSTIHEMESSTVPQAVVDALARSGGNEESVAWGVTLPAATSRQLERALQEYEGGELVIGADGNLRLEAS